MKKHNHQDKEILLKEIAGLKQRIKEWEQPAKGRNSINQPFQDHEEIYRFIAENTADIISIMNMDLHFTYISPSLTRIRGITPDEATTQTLEQILTPESLKTALAMYAEEMALEASGTADPARTRLVELEIYHKDGSGIWLENNISFLRNQQGAPTGILVVSRNITDRKRAEQTFMESESKYRSLFEASNDPIFILKDNICIECNPAAWKMYGITREQIIGTSPWDFSPPFQEDGIVSREKAVEKMDAALSSEPQFFEWKLMGPDEKVFDVEVSLVRIEFEGKNCILSIVRDITYRKTMEIALRESEQKYRTIFENTGTPLLFAAEDTTILLVNKEFEKLSGYPKEELEGKKKWKDFIVNKNDLARMIEYNRRRRVEPEAVPHSYEVQMVNKSGRLRDILVNVAIISESNMTLAGMVDITDRKKAEEAQKESEAKYRLIAENMVDVISILDMNLRYTYVSPSILRVRGFTVEEAMEQTLEETMTPESLQVAFKIFEEELQLETTGRADPKRTRILELEEYKNDGTLIRTENTLSFLRDENQKPVGILVLARDITERKQAEQALRESENNLRRIFDNTYDAIFIHDTDGKVLDVNQTLLDMYGVSREQALQMSIAEDFSTPNNPLDQLEHRWRRVLQGESVTFEWEAKRPNDGSIFDVEVALNGITLGNQKVVLANVRDITDRKALEEQLRQSQKMEAVGQLAGGVAHDFNNMLQAIIGYTEIVLSSPSLDDSDRDKILEVHHAGQRAGELTRQLLAFSRRQVLHLGPLNLNLIVNNLFKMLRRLIGENIELTSFPEKDLWTVNADRSQMEQVLMNLCINARDAMPQGGQLAIETYNVTLDDKYCAQIEWAKPGRYVQLNVTDSGSGMSPETRMKVFEPFFTTKEKGEGTGLGLATVYGIVRQHNGMIHVYSEIGKGSRFSVYLPVIETIKTATIPEPDRPVSEGHETILIAEDDERIRLLADEILKTAGYHVLMAIDGEDAIRIYHSCGRKIDLLLLDVVMPKKSGREVFDEIQSVNPAIKCLFMSGYSENAVHTNFILDNSLLLIQKPFNNNELLRMIRQTLDQPKIRSLTAPMS